MPQKSHPLNDQVNVRLPKPLHAAIVQEAQNGHRSMGDQMRMIVQRGFQTIYGYDPLTMNKKRPEIRHARSAI